MSRPNKPQFVVVHTVAAARSVSIHEIDGWHRERGFVRDATWRSEHSPWLTSFGYQYFIRKDGIIWSGRAELEYGSHCQDGSMNFKSIGVCFDGNGDAENFTRDQYDAFFMLMHGIRRRHPDILRMGSAAIIGHREVPGVKKSCPGIMVDMDKMRNEYRIRVIADEIKPIEALGLQLMPVR